MTRNKKTYTAARESVIQDIIRLRWPELPLKFVGSRPYEKGAKLYQIRDASGKPTMKEIKNWKSNRDALRELKEPNFTILETKVVYEKSLPEPLIEVGDEGWAKLSDITARLSQIRRAINLYEEASATYDACFGRPLPSEPLQRMKRAWSEIQRHVRSAAVSAWTKKSREERY